MPQTITFTVNGQRRTITTDPQRPLLEVLREDLQLTGAKYGCGEGQCGACTVLANGKPMRSCITPVATAQDKDIVTIEGISSGDSLHPVQAAFLADDAFQCGYCTPGMVLATVSLLKEKPDPTDPEITSSLQGHLCRCCGYPRILQAVRRAAKEMRRL